MRKLKKTLRWIWSHRTKALGFISVMLGVLATSTGMPEGWLKWFVLANGLVTAGVGYFNSQKPAPVQEK